MTPERKKMIGWNKVEEYYWSGKMVVYVNNRLTEESFQHAVDRLLAEQEKKT